MSDSDYVETPADADFDAFLSQMTPRKAQRDLTANFSSQERNRLRHLGVRVPNRAQIAEQLREERAARIQQETQIAIAMAQEMKNGSRP